jgi:phenylglyoxylate dehydrogenase beta subunit
VECNEKMIYLTRDNEGYMNTGIQQSSATPFGTATSTTPLGNESRGKPTGAKNLPLVMAMHDLPYVATATLSHLEDYAKKLVKARAKAKEGFVYLHVFCPCVVGWRIPTDSSIQVCREAVRTNYFPLWEAEEGVFRVTHPVKDPRPISGLTEILGKFKHLRDEEVAILQEQVDKRFQMLAALCAGSAGSPVPVESPIP